MLSKWLILPRYILMLGILILGSTGCGLKFGADARQAAENQKKNEKSSGFVEVDNTKPEPAVVAAKSPNSAKKADQPEKQTAKYVRVGKNRRLTKVDSEENQKAVPTEQASTPKAEQEKHLPELVFDKLKTTNRKILSKVRETHERIVDKVLGRKRPKKKVVYPTVKLYGAGLDESEWVLSSTELFCTLSQPVPRLGKVTFEYNPVQRLRFIFKVNHPVAKKLKIEDTHHKVELVTDVYPYPDVGAKLESVPPTWKPFAIKKTLGYIPLIEGYEPFVLPHRQQIPVTPVEKEVKRKAMKTEHVVASLVNNTLPEIWPDRLMYELEEGMLIRLTYRDWTDGTQDIITSISPINFDDVKGDFEKCIAKLPKYNFNKFKKTKLHFTKNQRVLSKKMKKQLRDMVKFVKLDETIKKVMIKSYTDSMGFKRVNREAAKIQAQAIKAYMRKLGMKIPITAIGIGEGPFVASNRSSAGRAKNRRSIITLIK